MLSLVHCRCLKHAFALQEVACEANVRSGILHNQVSSAVTFFLFFAPNGPRVLTLDLFLLLFFLFCFFSPCFFFPW